MSEAPYQLPDLSPLPPESPYRLLSFGHVQVQVQVAPITEHNLRIHLDAQSEQLDEVVRARREQGVTPPKVGVIIDGSVALMPPPSARKLQEQWLERHRRDLSLMTYRIGFVLPNPVLRTFLRAVFFVAPQPVPIVVHRSMSKAVLWATEQVDRIGGEVNDDLRRDGAFAVSRARSALLAGGW